MKEFNVEMDGHNFHCVVTYKNIRRSYMRFRDTSDLMVSAPYGTPLVKTIAFVMGNKKWLLKHMEDWRKRTPLEITDGMTLSLLGITYKVIFGETTKIDLDEKLVYLNQHENLHAELCGIAAQVLIPYATNKTAFFFNLLYGDSNIKQPTLIFKYLHSKFGHYDRIKHQIELSIGLALYDDEVVDYVIVHELAHIKEFNHQSGFYEEVAKVIPNYKTLSKRLKAGGSRL